MIKKRTQIRVGQSISGLPDLSVASVQRRLTSSISQQIVGSSRFSIDRLPERTIGLHSSKPMEDDCGQPGTHHKARFFSLRYLLGRRDQPMVLALSDMLRRQTILVANRE